ncbi:hypothetical protein PTSG_10624 [Salpingoeca rosetta]|uniref:HOOK N-terminal domain-containing protein n=1 Tax=Salpingoeca rosetta (strain ATCC 50818 / BSB-021) TaxID=946362 RepID=F2URW4_SALR5|nr:uncharacterized protein PTSG_10624 [Salpingoeca rosetta]EGD80369.1 hypothetical protein PTSG_10624 [Salpingoeca rosetta]|eukprot:XP_004988159.1 hypothetical protein PTSG_10624 [Salpingoeca rosetta]
MAEAKELQMLIRWVSCIPSFFTDDLYAKVRRDASNDRTKMMNVQKASHTLAAFLAAKFKVPEHEVPTPNEEAVVEGDAHELTVLLRLLVTCAVNSSKRETYVQRILADNDLAQHLMSSIQAIQAHLQQAAEEVTRVRAGSEGDDPVIARLQKDLDETRHRLRHLEIEHDAVVDDNRELERELGETKAALAAAEASGSGSSEEDQQRIHDLTTALAEMEDALKAEQQDHEATKKDCQRALAEMNRQLDRAMAESAEHQKQLDEMQELRQQADQVPALESRLATLKTQLEEAVELKRQAMSAQEQNAENIKRIVELETKEKRVDELQEELAETSKKLAALEEELLDEQKRSDRLQHEADTQRDTCARLKEDKTRLLREKGALEQQLELSSAGDISAAGLGGGVDLERLIRLEHENATLKAQVEGGDVDQKVAKIKAMADAAQKGKQELQKQNRELSLTIAKLETEVKSLKEGDGVQTTSGVAIEKLAVCERKLDAANKELATKSEMCDKLKSQLSASQEKLLEAQKKLSLVGLDQKEVVEKARDAAMKDVQDKLNTLEKVSNELAQLKERHAALMEEKNQLARENADQMKKITTILTQKDELNSKILALKESGAGGGGSSDELQRVKEQLRQARVDYKRLENEKIAAAAATSGDGSGEGGKYIQMLQQKIQDLEAEIATKTSELDRQRARFEREQRLMTSAWISLSVEQQKLSVRERERNNAAPRGQSFLEVQRRKAMERKAVSHAS